jgi:cell division protein FtsW (lipid II flippase)
MKTKSGLLLALFIISLIFSICLFFYGLGLLVVYMLSSKINDYTESQKRQFKIKFGLSIGFGLAGMILFTVLLTYFYK